MTAPKPQDNDTPNLEEGFQQIFGKFNQVDEHDAQDNESADLREMTKNSIARLVAHRRGADEQDDKDLITASNILMVCSRLITQERERAVREGMLEFIVGGIVFNDGPVKDWCKKQYAALKDSKDAA